VYPQRKFFRTYTDKTFSNRRIVLVLWLGILEAITLPAAAVNGLTWSLAGAAPGVCDARNTEAAMNNDQGSCKGDDATADLRIRWFMNFQREVASRCYLLLVSALLLAVASTSASSGKPALPMEAGHPSEPALTSEWADLLLAKDPKVRARAQVALVQKGQGSFPVLKGLLEPEREELRVASFQIIQRIGPPAIPLLVELLRDKSKSIRRAAISELIDLAPHTEGAQAALRRALKDEDAVVAGDAARALGALGKRASPSVGALVKTLAHKDPYVRVYAAEALASIGPGAAKATSALVEALRDPVPGVRWAACEGLASMGPAASRAVPKLIEALQDEFRYVRICAAGALGAIGPKAQSARQALRAATKEPALRQEAEWALSRITGTGGQSASHVEPAPSVAPTVQAEAVQAGNPPVDWDTATGRNVVWSVELGNETYGRPVVAGDAVYVGTDNARRLNPREQEEAGVLAAFRAKDGKFLWQDVASRVERGLREFLLPSTTSAPYVEGNRLYYVTAECQLRCLDTQGFRDGVNDGPYRDELFQDEAAADIVWELDMCSQLGVFPHEAANSEVLAVGDLLMVSTSNGQNEGHTGVPSPRAPSLVAVNKRTGQVVWRAIGAGAHVLHGQWSSPVAANVNGRVQVLFGGGDGWLRAYDAASGHELWRFDGNPKEAPLIPRPGVLSRGAIIASPVFDEGRVFAAMGQSPGHLDGPSLVHAINPNGQGDVTESKLIWTSREVGRVVGTPMVKDGLLYIGDLGGVVHCLDAATGARIWKHDTSEAIWGCLLLAGDRLYVGNAGGAMTVLRAGRRKELLAQIEMDAPLYSRPAQVGDALYLATANRLYCIAASARIADSR
jgi:outer membrane protein assembly factor BamB/HEAT repeat protein